MIPEEYKALIQELSEATEAGKAKWETTEDPFKYIINLNDVSATIERFNTYPDDAMCTRFQIKNIFGEVADSFEVDQFENDEFAVMDKLYVNARLKARNIDFIIGSLRDGLKRL